ncbi:MAG: ABC transporter permease [Filifactoraceae bacterium]
MIVRLIKRLYSFLEKYGILLGVFILWTFVSEVNLIPKYMLPSPIDVIKAFINDFQLLMKNTVVSLTEAVLGLTISILVSFIIAILMDRYEKLYRIIYPSLIVSQTIPVIAIAPLLVLWMGYGLAPKIFLVFLVCFFPLAVSLLDGLRGCDKDYLFLLRTMKATENQILFHVKLPMAFSSMFTGLKVSVAYAVVGAVIAEWLGGEGGLGVYMTRVRKSYAFDKMFAVIILISIISLMAIKVVSMVEKRAMPWKDIKTINKRRSDIK